MATGASVPAPLDESLGPFRLLARLGRGGMGSVYLARRTEYDGFERLVALKCMHPQLAADEDLALAFIEEARIALSITHPFVCRVIDYGKCDDTYYIAMEPLIGESLRRITAMVPQRPELRNSRRFPLLAARVIANLCEGLHAAHEVTDEHGRPLEVVHRDITPHNLYLLYDGTVRLIDFGIARGGRRRQPTHHGVIKGKLGYLAPEQLLSGQSDRRADVWAMGIVLWELLTGRRLFHAESPTDTVAALLDAPIAAPSTILPSVPRELDRVVLRALSRDPTRRQSTAREMAVELERVLACHADPMPAADTAGFLEALFPGGAKRLCEMRGDEPRASADSAKSSERPRWGSSPAFSSSRAARRRDRGVSTMRIDPPPASVRTRALRRRRAMLVGIALALGPIVAIAASRELDHTSVRTAELGTGFSLSDIHSPIEPPQPEPPPATPARKHGFVVIETVTGSAHITVAGRYVGQTPIRVRVAAGSHWLVARRVDGPGVQGMRVDVPSGKLVHAIVRLPE